MKLLVRSGVETYCPFKGDCSQYSIPIGGQKSVNAAWSYEDPYFEADEIKEHTAFRADRVDSIAENVLQKRDESMGKTTLKILSQPA
jgi:uncharacterized protein (DUF427 family)